MLTPLRLTIIASAMAATLTLAGCSYTPARVQSEPLIEIDDGHGNHRHHRRDDRHYRDHDYQDRYDRDRHHDRDRRYRGDGDRYRDRRHRDDHRRGGFCPPGLRMQGRC